VAGPSRKISSILRGRRHARNDEGRLAWSSHNARFCFLEEVWYGRRENIPVPNRGNSAKTWRRWRTPQDSNLWRFSEEQIATELRLQEVVHSLREQGDLASQLSLWNLRPSFLAQFFRTTCTDWSPLKFASVLSESAEHWYAYSETENVVVAVVCRAAGVKWGKLPESQRHHLRPRDPALEQG
jgi:hypothetical protein